MLEQRGALQIDKAQDICAHGIMTNINSLWEDVTIKEGRQWIK